MIKRDKIFYSACAISAVGILLALLGYEFSLLFFVAAYLLRPSLHEFGLAKKLADERQREIHSRSGNMAFVMLMLALAGITLWRMAQGESVGDLITLMGIGYAARSLTGLIMAGEYKRAGVLIISAAGVFFALFILAVEGFSIVTIGGAVVGLIIMGIGQLARKFPRTIAIVEVILAVLIVTTFRLFDLSKAPIQMWMFFVIPVITSALCLFLGARNKEEYVTPKVRTWAFGSLGAGVATVFTLMVIMGSGQKKAHGFTTPIPEGESKEINGVSCTGNIEFYKNGVLEYCDLAREDTLSGQVLQAGTGVHFTEEGVFDWCFLREDVNIQGVDCSGDNNNGFMTGFYPNGQLRMAWLTKDQEIQGIPCSKFRFFSALFVVFHHKNGGTYFHENGQLKYCELSKDFTIQGKDFKRYDAVRFDEHGTLVDNFQPQKR